MSTRRAKSPRRKPKQARAQDTIEVVLDAAARVLALQGYAGATTNRIAAAAGVSVGTVYEYFENKDAVFEALIRRELARLVQAFAEQGLVTDEPLEASVRRLIVAGMEAMRHGPELFRGLEAVPGAVFRNQLGEARALVIRQVRRFLDLHRDEVSVPDLDLAAFIVVTAVEGVGASATRDQLDGLLADEATTLVVRYLARDASAGGGAPAPAV